MILFLDYFNHQLSVKLWNSNILPCLYCYYDETIGAGVFYNTVMQQRSIMGSNLGRIFEPHQSNMNWFITTECRKSCDTVSYVKLNTQQ